MTKRKEKGFTLLELIAVLVIMSILALIVTPLVMNIIRKARIAADKRSIDAYGRSIELAIAGYLLDTGKFPTEVSQLTIEYSGDTVTCETTQINSDSSVYLAGCKVKNRNVEGYAYGKDLSPSYEAYSIGDEVTYNGVDYYVIKDSGVKDNVVILLKATPLITAEVNQYGGAGTDNNHVNRYTSFSQGVAYDENGYGGMAYYTSSTCDNHAEIYTGCTVKYEDSEIKCVVDAWKTAKAPAAIKARLITSDEYYSLTIAEEYETPSDSGIRYVPQYDWICNGGYGYWTNNVYQDSLNSVIKIGNGYGGTGLYSDDVYSYYTLVRPVVELYKNDGITRKTN